MKRGAATSKLWVERVTVNSNPQFPELPPLPNIPQSGGSDAQKATDRDAAQSFPPPPPHGTGVPHPVPPHPETGPMQHGPHTSQPGQPPYPAAPANQQAHPPGAPFGGYQHGMQYGPVPGPPPYGAPQPKNRARRKKRGRAALIVSLVVVGLIVAAAVPVGWMLYQNAQPKYLLSSHNEIRSISIDLTYLDSTDSCRTEARSIEASQLATDGTKKVGDYADDATATREIFIGSMTHPSTITVSEVTPYAREITVGDGTEPVEFLIFRADDNQESSFHAVRVFDASDQFAEFIYKCSGDEANYKDFISAFEKTKIRIRD